MKKLSRQLIFFLMFLIATKNIYTQEQSTQWLSSTINWCTKPPVIIGALAAASLYAIIKHCKADCTFLKNSTGNVDGVLCDIDCSFYCANRRYSYHFIEKEERRYPLDECKRVIIHNTLGSITVVEHEHASVDIQITKRGYTQPILHDIEIVSSQEGETIEITSLNPRPLAAVVAEPLIQFPLLSSLWSRNILINTSRIDYLICIPDGFIAFDLSTVVGDVGVYAGRGPVRAYSQYGECFISD